LSNGGEGDFVLGSVTFHRSTILTVSRQLRSTQPDHSSMGQAISSGNGYAHCWERNCKFHVAVSRYQDCWHTGLMYASGIGYNFHQLKSKEMSYFATDLMVYG